MITKLQSLDPEKLGLGVEHIYLPGRRKSYGWIGGGSGGWEWEDQVGSRRDVLRKGMQGRHS